jgi:hypothetical protein
MESKRIMEAMPFIAQIPDSDAGDKLIEDMIDRYTQPSSYLYDTGTATTDTLGYYRFDDENDEFVNYT